MKKKTKKLDPPTRRSKIARLSAATRAKVNEMLDDGKTAAAVAKWLNDRPKSSKDFSAQNVNKWRQTGYIDDNRRRERVERTKSLHKYALNLVKDGWSLAEGATVIAEGEILAELESTTVDDEKFWKLVSALAKIREGNIKRAALENKKRELALSEQRFQRETAEMFRNWLKSPEGSAMVTSGEVNRMPVSKLVEVFFGKRPAHITKDDPTL